MAPEPPSMRQILAVASAPVNLAGYDTASRPGAPTGKNGKPKKFRTVGKELAALQERLWAEASAGGTRSILLVLQGTDTSGKGGVTEHVVGSFGPIGVQYTGFKKPIEEEASHDFLWRIRKRLPPPGVIGVFDRSHYEDVLVPRVHELIPESEWQARYRKINAFEAKLAADDTTLVKCFLHISYDTQRERLLARLDDPEKHWKFHEGDLAERARWSDYATAFEGTLDNCNTPDAPWYIVPSDSKKYRNWAIGELLRETLEELDPRFPQPALDVDTLRQSLQPPN